MSLFGALSSGVTGLTSQGVNIAMISDNIANINTIGYKSSEASFSTLITASGSSTTSAGGGVSASQRNLVDQQGLIQNTGIGTDLAISGDGFFVVNSSADASGDYLYTRAGSFRKDSRGSFINAGGNYLLGWQLDSNGDLPATPDNLDSLKPVNVKSVSGVAAATTKVNLGINLNGSQALLKGAGKTIDIINTSPNNANGRDSIIVPNTLTPDTGHGLRITQGGTNYDYVYGGYRASNDITTTILGANTNTATFNGAGVSDGQSFTVATNTTGTVTFTFRNAVTPNASKGEFNSLESLKTAINNVTGLTARVQGNRLYMAPKDANELMDFTDVTGTFAAALGLTDTVAGTNRFASLGGLADMVSKQTSIASIITNPIDNTRVEVHATDPLGTISFANLNVGSNFLTEFGLTAGPFGPAYDPSGAAANNMAGGKIQPHFTRNIRVYDSLGTGHDLQAAYAKLANNTWSMEVFALNPKEIVSNRTDGLIASGTIFFNGDGSLRSVDSALTNPLSISWANQSSDSQITLDLGTAGPQAGTTTVGTQVGLTNGLRQFNFNYSVEFVDQNGVSAGLLNGVTVDKNGFVIASFSNGQSRKIFQVPLATFKNPNGLKAASGNSYAESDSSGNFNLKVAGSGEVGTISPSSLESANVELADELTKMIVSQRAYQASSKVIQTVDQLLEELNQAF